MKSVLFVAALLLSHSAFAIDSADKVIKSIECSAEKTPDLVQYTGNDTVATVYLKAERATPDEPLRINYTEEFWATTGNGPQHRVLTVRDVACTTLRYRSRASSFVGRAHYELTCYEGGSLVRLDLDSKAKNGVYLGVAGLTGRFALACSYTKF
ncbi:hypothetical protein ACLWBD_01090 [Bdellovibrio sp. HCB117]|uniref:hypothetical protein n=1 Tax=Bdellovibrio sp. HCB117 TaxID=3394359 RepID=UPI0039B49385